jgi:hypothetical protein
MSEPTHWASSSMTNLRPRARVTFSKSYRLATLALRDSPFDEGKLHGKYSRT